MFGRFLKNRSGSFAVTTALMILPLILMVGFGIDGSRYYNARTHLQDAVDMAALALAASPEQDTAKLRAEADKFIIANLSTDTVENVKVSTLAADADTIKLTVTGQIRTTFMKLADFDVMAVAATTLAMRAPMRAIEVALVLDNTHSMSEVSGGTSKIDTLKEASRDLVNTLMSGAGNSIKIALVPYADYVNVGLKNRNASWLDVQNDYSVTSEKICVKKTTKTQCKPGTTKPTYSCTKIVDGIEEPSTCGGGCENETVDVPPYDSCTGGSTTNYKWFGCVRSRLVVSLRLNDDSPTVKYPGGVDGNNKLDTQIRCPTEIVPLTISKDSLNTAIEGMVTNRKSGSNIYYKPLTYIPTGLIWGQNVLSPTEPFTEAEVYDPTNENRVPRKIMILMTDGDNTLLVNSNGTHAPFDNNAKTAAKQFAATNSDTQSICNYVKSRKIELYTVAFMVDNDVARALLESCASDKAHYFDASDRTQLLEAFRRIARSISDVRIAK